MIPRNDIARIALTVFCVMVLMPGEMLSIAGVEPGSGMEPDALEEGGITAGAEATLVAGSTWEGGGPLVYFEDDLSEATRDHYESFGVEGYYGGAVPDAGAGANRWRNEPLRWGIDAPEEEEPWQVRQTPLESEGWRFGEESEDRPSYPLLGGESGVVTPLIDLRNVPKVNESRDLNSDTGMLVVTGPSFGYCAVYPLVASLFSQAPDVVRELDPNLIDRCPPQKFVQEDHDESVGISEASAALRLRHAYDFALSSAGGLADGARVEVSIKDHADEWTPWIGMEPVEESLQIGNETIQARRASPSDHAVTAEGEADANVSVHPDAAPSEEEVENWTSDPDSAGDDVPSPEELVTGDPRFDANATATGPPVNREEGREGAYVRTDSDETSPLVEIGLVNETRPPPWLYQGPVSSSPETWRGFGGSSDGFVDSVFDLSPLAGHVVRLRLVTATAAETHAFDSRPLAGWTVDRLQVTGQGDSGMDVVTMESPGNGAVLSGDADFPLSVLVHNRMNEPTVAEVEFDLETGRSGSQTVFLGSGATGRRLVSAPESFRDLARLTEGQDASGLHRVMVTATPQADGLEGPLGASVPKGTPAERRFHFGFGPGGGPEERGWEIVDMEVEPLDVEIDRGRLISRNQPVEVRATLRNLNPSSFPLHLNESGLHPVFWDSRNKPVGDVKPGEDLGNKVELPVSRDVSGALGETDADVHVNWTWSGSPSAQALQIVLLDGTKVIRNGGGLLVDSMGPIPLDVDGDNPWNLGDQTGDGNGNMTNDCDRFVEMGDRQGIVRCHGGDTLVSPVFAVDPSIVQRVAAQQETPGADLQVSHRSGNFTVRAYVHDSEGPLRVSRPSPLDEDWKPEPFALFEIEASQSWNVTRASENLPEGCLQEGQRGCWIYLAFTSDATWDLSEVLLEIGDVEVTWERFQTRLKPEEPILVAQDAEEGMIWLHGRDRWATVFEEDVSDGGVHLPEQNCGGSFDGDIDLEPCAGFQDGISAPTGRVLEESIYQVGPHLLDDVKPVLAFDHWYALGSGAWAAVEIAPSLRGEPGAWEELIRFKGTQGIPPSMNQVEVSLAEFAGENVHLRFRYDVDPQADLQWEGWGWILGHVRIEGKSGNHKPVSLASGDFQNADQVDHFDPEIDTGATVSRTLQDPHIHLEFSTDTNPCASGNRPNRYGHGPKLVTDRVDLTSTVEPVLDLVHWGQIGPSGRFGDRRLDRVMIDLEYQVMGPDGEWPDGWLRATPHEYERDAHGDPDLKVPESDSRLMAANGTRWVGPPFYEFWAEASETSPWTNTFGLDPLKGEVVRFRLQAWSWFDSSGSTSGSNCFDFLDWHIGSMRIREQDHFVDVATRGIELDRNDVELLRLDPDVKLKGAEGVIADDRLSAFVTVANEGSLPLEEVEVTLEADYLGTGDPAGGLEVRFVDQDGQRARRGILENLEPERLGGQEAEARFLIDARDARPGLYRLTAVSDPVGDDDTKPDNDVSEMVVLVAPYRELDVDLSESVVAPFAGTPDVQRRVEAVVVNRGNVDEKHVEVRADLVERVGLTKTQPVPISEDVFDVRNVSLARRDGFARIDWSIHGDHLLDPEGKPILEAGGQYAIQVTLKPGEESVETWWENENGPINVTEDGTLLGEEVLLNRTHGRKILIPFLVEDAVLQHDFGEDGESVVPSLFPYDASWTAETRVDGDILENEDEKPWVPRWRLDPASQIGAEGRSSGNAWHLPPYEGVEAVEHTLTSPPLPSHVAAANSRAILDMQYAHELAEGQAKMEFRSLQKDGDEWDPREGPEGQWRPVDSTRAERVAVIVAPDFPRVTGTWIDPSYPIQITSGYRRGYDESYEGTRPITPVTVGRAIQWEYENRTVPGHPWPPFYQQLGDGMWRAEECEDEENTPFHQQNFPDAESGFCAWSPFPAERSEGDPEWVDAFNGMMNQLIEEIGPTNIGVYTAFGDDFNLSTKQEPWNHTLVVPHSDAADRDYQFPIGDLDSLGVRLDSYGAVLVVGDNATTTLAGRSASLGRMAQEGNQTHAFNKKPHEDWVHFHDQVHEILRGAENAGVRVVGAIGPATGNLALSGAADEETVALWRTPPSESPGWANRPLEFHPGQVRCTIENDPSSETSEYDRFEVTRKFEFVDEEPLGPQPLEMCEFDRGWHDIAYDTLFNYYYFSPQDARSLALRDFAGLGRVDWTYNEPVVESQSDPDGPRFITARDVHHHEDWIETVLEELRTADGSIAAGSGGWEPLPAELAFYYAGDFEPGKEGEERFIGNPAQFRIRITADPELGGHGFFALDRFALLASPPDDDLGIRFIQPVHDRDYGASDRFPVQIEVTNRGLNATDPLSGVEVQVKETTGDCAQGVLKDCTQLDEPLSHSPNVDSLGPGDQQVIEFGIDETPGSWSRWRFPPDEGSEFEFQAELPERSIDKDSFNDMDNAVVRTNTVRSLSILDMRLEPNTAAYENQTQEGFDVVLTLANKGTGVEDARPVVRLHGARPIDCYEPGNPDADPSDDPSGSYRACHPVPDQHFGEMELVGGKTLRIGPNSIREFRARVEDLINLDLPPGEFLVAADVRLLEKGSLISHDKAMVWMNLADDDQGPTHGWPYQVLEWSRVSGDLPHPVATTPRHGEHEHLQGNWMVPPEHHDVAVDGNARQSQDETRHRGAYDEDPATRGPDGEPLAHGWRVREDFDGGDGPFDGPRLVWQRDSQPSTDLGWLCNDRTSEVKNCPPGGMTNGHVADEGDDDFGPDWIVWQPHYGEAGMPLSLAAFEDPKLRLHSRYQITENTVLVVQAQVPKRMCSDFREDQGEDQVALSALDHDEHVEECRWEWSWGHQEANDARGEHMWITLEGNNARIRDIDTESAVCQCDCPNPGNPRIPEWRCRPNTPSNPLGDELGIWGGRSDGIHEEVDPWQVLEFDLSSLIDKGGAMYEYCLEAQSSEHRAGLEPGAGSRPSRELYFASEKTPSDAPFDRDRNPCRWAWSNGFWSGGEKSGDWIPRPIRFRFLAASNSADAGFNHWEIADLSVTDHELRFEDPTRDVQMTDNAAHVEPFRLTNPSRVTDGVTVTWSYPEGYTPPGDLEVSLGRTPLGPFDESHTFTMNPGQTVPIYVRVEVGLEHGFNPGLDIPVPLVVHAQSQADPTTFASGLLEGEFLTRPWADLEGDCLIIEDDDACDDLYPGAAEGVPRSVTVVWRNSGHLPSGSETHPILIRLVEEQLDPETGEVVSSRVARDAEDRPAERLIQEPVPPSTGTDRHMSFEWNPPERGLFRLQAEVNLPHETDDLMILPESDYGNNRFGRMVNVGAVPLSDLRVRDAWLEDFHTGERTSRLIDGHLYVVAAEVANEGQAPARDFATEFRIGAADPFSRAARASFPGDPHEETITSTPWRARLRADGGAEWTFAVDVSTITPEASVEGKTFSWDVRVNSYGLRVADAPRNVTLLPGQEVRVPLNLTNTGNAPAIPTAGLSSAFDGVEAHMGGSSRIDVEETREVTLVIVADDGLVEEDELPRVVLGTLEDPLLEVPVRTELIPRVQGSARAAAQPFNATPGPALVTVGLVNDANARAIWRVEDATPPLAVLPWETEVAPFSAQRAEAAVRVLNGTLPGTYHAELKFAVQSDDVERVLRVPVQVEVDPEARFRAHADPEDQTVPMGRPGSVLVHATNLGNVPLQVGLNHTVDDGSLEVLRGPLNLTLPPGQTRTEELRVKGDQGVRHVLGASNVTWAWSGRNASGIEEIPWRVAYEPGRVRVAHSGLEGLKAEAGTRQEVAVSLENPTDRSVDAEALLLVDGTVHGVAHTVLVPQGTATVHLPFQPGVEGEEHDLMVLARPAGSTVNLTDSVYYEIGDADSSHIVVAPSGETEFSPGSGIVFVMLMFVAVVVFRRRSR